MQKESNTKNFAERIKAQMARAMERLRQLGAKQIMIGEIRALYIPGNVNISAPFSPDSYGEYIASRKRTHKHYLRTNHLGKFRKGRS